MARLDKPNASAQKLNEWCASINGSFEIAKSQATNGIVDMNGTPVIDQHAYPDYANETIVIKRAVQTTLL